MPAEDIIKHLGLEPLPGEGGYYREVYRSEDLAGNPGDRYSGMRSFSTAIYYLLTQTTFSHLHRLKSDEVYHYYTGDPVEMLLLYPDGLGKTVVLGCAMEIGQNPMFVVPKGTWQGTKLIQGGSWALMGTTVSPGFDFEDYEQGIREDLIADFPLYSDMIRALTHE